VVLFARGQGQGQWSSLFRAGDALESWAKLGFGAVPNKPASHRHRERAEALLRPLPLSLPRANHPSTVKYTLEQRA
jgi:hypothetical protein